MSFPWAVEIAGTGKSIPEQVVTNHDFAARLDTSDEWIVQRTGIRERRVLAEGCSTLDLAQAASEEALRDAGLTAADIDMIICCTFTPPHPLPALACELQAALGCRWVPAFDLAAACSGFVYGFIVGAQHIHNGLAKNVLIVGAECLTRVIDQEDRSTAILFGDAGGAAILRPATGNNAILASRTGADGARWDKIWVPAGGAKEPASERTVAERLHYMRMAGRDVYKFAVTQMQGTVRETLDDAGVSLDELRLLVPHQSNLRIIESACERLGLPIDRVLININKYGNTSAASVPVALHEAREQNRFGPGDLVMLVAFGAGLTWGSALIRI